MKGEDPGDLSEGTFYGRPVWQRFIVTAAGPVFNFLLAWILSAVLLSLAGVDMPVIMGVAEGSPAEQAGLTAGDTIIRLDGKKIRFYREISDYISFHQDRLAVQDPINIVWEHEGERHEADVIAMQNESGRYILGLYGSFSYRTRVNVFKAAEYAVAETGYWIGLVFESIRMLFDGRASVSDLSGPVGVVSTISDTVEETKSDGYFYVFLNILNMAVLLSANLGVVNLLPVPVLDGGRLALLIVEAVRRKRLRPETEMRIQMTGVVLLLMLMGIVMFNDIRRLF